MENNIVAAKTKQYHYLDSFSVTCSDFVFGDKGKMCHLLLGKENIGIFFQTKDKKDKLYKFATKADHVHDHPELAIRISKSENKGEHIVYSSSFSVFLDAYNTMNVIPS